MSPHRNPITDEGLAPLLELWGSGTVDLTNLYIMGLQVTDASAEAVALNIKRSSHIVEIMMDANHSTSPCHVRVSLCQDRNAR